MEFYKRHWKQTRKGQIFVKDAKTFSGILSYLLGFNGFLQTQQRAKAISKKSKIIQTLNSLL